MAEETERRILDPMERILEILFGLIMALTFTGTLSVAESGHAEVRTMLAGALGCNIAWGLIDAIMYLMSGLAEKSRTARLAAAVRAAPPDEAGRIIARELPPVVASALGEDDFRRIREAVRRLPSSDRRMPVSARELGSAFAIFLLVVGATLPVTLPFLFVPGVALALRVSNAVAIAMLFALGHAYGRHAGYSPLLVALLMVVLGVILVAITIALGG